MKYSNSADGVKRASIRIIVRVDQEDVQSIRRDLRRAGKKGADKEVREFVESCTETTWPERREGYDDESGE